MKVRKWRWGEASLSRSTIQNTLLLMRQNCTVHHTVLEIKLNIYKKAVYWKLAVKRQAPVSEGCVCFFRVVFEVSACLVDTAVASFDVAVVAVWSIELPLHVASLGLLHYRRYATSIFISCSCSSQCRVGTWYAPLVSVRPSQGRWL